MLVPNALETLQEPACLIVDELAANGEPELLRQLFYSRTARWKYYIVSGEFGTITLFSDLCDCLSKMQAFTLIPTAIGIVLDQEDPELFTTSLALLLDLSCCSDTTEMPLALSEQWSRLAKKIDELPADRHRAFLWKQLTHWYRRRSGRSGQENAV